MRLRHGTFLTTLGTVVLIPVIARTQQAISISYTATVLNYKGVPVTKPDVHIAGAIIEFDTSKGTHIKASCLMPYRYRNDDSLGTVLLTTRPISISTQATTNYS
jgi:hypothetical protein